MVKVETLDSILEFFQDEDVQEKAAEVGRLFFTNGSVTVNLIPILLFSFLGSLLFLPLLLPAYDALSSLYSSALSSNSVAYSATNYGTPVAGYGYSARSSAIELTDEQKALYPEIAELREKIERLQADEYNIRSQLYYGSAGVANTGTGGSAAYDGVTGDTAAYTY